MRVSFRSIYHPDGLPASHVFGRALVRPVAACVVPIMIGATVAVLEWTPVWPFFSVGLPLALGVATVWTHFTLRRQPAALHLRPGEAAVQSVWDVMRDHRIDWHPLLDARVSPSETLLTLRLNTVTLSRQTWPEFDALQEAVEDTRRAGSVSQMPG